MKNRASNYRVVINEKHDYGGRSSPHTSTSSVRQANAPASRRFKSAILKLPHLNQVLNHQGCNNNKDKKEKEDEEDEEEYKVSDSKKESSHAFHKALSGEKHRQKKKEKNQKDEYQYQYQYDRYGQQTQQHGQHQLYPSKTRPNKGIQGYDTTIAKTVNETISSAPASERNDKRKKDYKRVSNHIYIHGSIANSFQSQAR